MRRAAIKINREVEDLIYYFKQQDWNFVIRWYDSNATAHFSMLPRFITTISHTNRYRNNSFLAFSGMVSFHFPPSLLCTLYIGGHLAPRNLLYRVWHLTITVAHTLSYKNVSSCPLPVDHFTALGPLSALIAAKAHANFIFLSFRRSFLRIKLLLETDQALTYECTKP